MQGLDITIGPADAGKCEKTLEPRVKSGQGLTLKWLGQCENMPHPTAAHKSYTLQELKATPAHSWKTGVTLALCPKEMNPPIEQMENHKEPFTVLSLPGHPGGQEHNSVLSLPPGSFHIPVGPTGSQGLQKERRCEPHTSYWSPTCGTSPGTGWGTGQVLMLIALCHVLSA